MSEIVYERLADEEAEHGKPPLKGYLVRVDGRVIGCVFQKQYRWSRMTSNGRIRLRDYYPVEWAYALGEAESVGYRYAPRHQRARTRRDATEFLMRLV